MESKNDKGLCAEADSPPGKKDQEALDRSIRGPSQQLQETVEGMDSWAGIAQKKSD
jgi:hypothetical protein